tara:strand:- start:1543 stop:2067 length:525 start_codon:yes stop_codon:yes gene_type:complete
MKERIQTIATECAQKIDKMFGPWVIPTNGYEKSFCKLLGWKCVNGRWSDASNKDTNIEIKKGQDSMWFDMVRYAEIFTGKGQQQTVTVFFRYDKKKEHVREIYIIDTRQLLLFLNLTTETSEFCIKMHKETQRGLNMQASATSKDMRKMALIVIRSKREVERTKKRKRSLQKKN